jgi:hypothetical protein
VAGLVVSLAKQIERGPVVAALNRTPSLADDGIG